MVGGIHLLGSRGSVLLPFVVIAHKVTEVEDAEQVGGFGIWGFELSPRAGNGAT